MVTFRPLSLPFINNRARFFPTSIKLIIRNPIYLVSLLLPLFVLYLIVYASFNVEVVELTVLPLLCFIGKFYGILIVGIITISLYLWYYYFLKFDWHPMIISFFNIVFTSTYLYNYTHRFYDCTILSLAHKAMISLKYACMSSLEYNRLMSTYKLGLIVRYQFQLQLITGWLFYKPGKLWWVKVVMCHYDYYYY